MTGRFEGMEISVPAGFGARERAYLEAVRKYGLSIELNQVGWDYGDGYVTYEVLEVTE